MSNVKEDRAKFSHKVFKNNPLIFKSYINKKVIITTVDKSVHTGVVYTVDPVSQSIVLVRQLENAALHMEIVIGHAIKCVEVSTESGFDVPELFLAPSVKMSESAIGERKNAVKELLLKNRFPITEDNGVLHIKDVISIEPPYGPEHCISTNESNNILCYKLISSQRFPDEFKHIYRMDPLRWLPPFILERTTDNVIVQEVYCVAQTEPSDRCLARKLFITYRRRAFELSSHSSAQ